MKKYNFKISRILTIALASAAMMGVTTVLDNVSTVHADEVSDSAVTNSNDQTQTNDNIVTGTWGTAPWTWNKTTGEMTVGGGEAGYAVNVPWRDKLRNIKKITFTGEIILPYDCLGLFNGLEEVTSIDGMNNLDTSKVANMRGMFADMSNLSNLNLDNFDTSSATGMEDMFNGDRSLKSLNLDVFNTSKVTDMSGMFAGMSSLKSLDLSNFNTSRVTSMYSMFENMTNLSNLNVNNFDTSKVVYMHSMFNGDGIKNLNLSSFDTSNVKSMNEMFANTTMDSINLNGFNTSKVTEMIGMFRNTKFTDLDLNNFDTSKVTSMKAMFSEDDLKYLDLSNFNTSKVTDMNTMFANTTLNRLNLSNFNTSNVNNMNIMFYNVKLKYLDISSFDMSKVYLMRDMFGNNSNINTIVVGSKNKFERDVNLPEVPTTDGYSGKWQNIKDSNGNNINNGSLYTSEDLMTNYTPEKAGTYTWAKKSTSDIKDLYNKVKLSISYSGSMFNSQPGDSMKYKDEFNGRSMFGTLDYAYNSNNYDESIKVMHDSIKKTHESIGSLQVNEAKAQELGLNVDQLKADLVKDSVPYDYSQDNDIDGINKQLDSFASVRAKYNKLVQEGVFDKSDYWTVK
ncbi:BspA family leucine-rich repeat surface protein [Companilactobacillus nuruki]|uniref:BspA family leucine-rich repeat surface protein n=1 Tax=Companilactobacillus nuruki TaxID=1993540 RepID=UPI001416F8FC|nr:BspA family leucine-rich repeat surface protein [Companilactobacillus nuruki]